MITSETLTRLYGTPIEVLKTSSGRLVVVGEPEAPFALGIKGAINGKDAATHGTGPGAKKRNDRMERTRISQHKRANALMLFPSGLHSFK